MKRITRRAVAIRLAPFLLALIASLSLSFVHSIYLHRQAVFTRAAYEGDLTRMKVMYALGVKVNEPACPYRGCLTPLVAAGWGGHREAIQYLLDRGADVNKTGKFGATPLMMAAYSGSDESIEVLLLRGAKLNTTDRNGNTALSLAKQGEHWTTIDLLRRAGATENP